MMPPRCAAPTSCCRSGSSRQRMKKPSWKFAAHSPAPCRMSRPGRCTGHLIDGKGNAISGQRPLQSAKWRWMNWPRSAQNCAAGKTPRRAKAANARHRNAPQRSCERPGSSPKRSGRNLNFDKMVKQVPKTGLGTRCIAFGYHVSQKAKMAVSWLSCEVCEGI